MSFVNGTDITPRTLLLRACAIDAFLAEALSIQFDAELGLSVEGREGLVAILRQQERTVSEALCLLECGAELDDVAEILLPEIKSVGGEA